MNIKARYLYIIGVALLAADVITKIMVKTSMTLGENISVFGSWFNIHFIENPGAAWGFELGGDSGKLILSLFRIVAVSFVAWYITRLHRRNAPAGVQIAAVAILIGAFGNIVDSAFFGLIFSESTHYAVSHFTAWGDGYGTFLHGNVVDMLYFPIIEIDHVPSWVPIWGGGPFVFFSAIFNLADSYISVAMIYLILFQRKFFK
ncbi:MAG: lipoprotein signal peptidase [Mucinivorans sp.]